MTHEAAEQLLATHALGGLEASEAAGLRHHLAGCADCRALAGHLHDVVDRLALSVDDAEPPEGMRARMLAKVYAEATGRDVAASREPLWRRLWARIPERRWLTAGGALGTGLATAAAIVFATHARVEQSSPVPRHYTVASCGLVGEPRACGTMTYDADTRQAVFRMTGLATIARVNDRPTASYEVWLVRADHSAKAAAYLTRSPDGKSWTAALSGDLGSYTAVAATVEPSQGSSVPSGMEILRVELPQATVVT